MPKENNMQNVDIKKISKYLAGKLPPYYWKSNSYAFSKALQNFSKKFTKKELNFVYQQAQQDDEKFYFMILDTLWDKQEQNKKEDILIMLKNLGVPMKVLGYYTSENIKKFKDTLKSI